MKRIVTCISLLICMLSLFATAYADVPDPYGRPRPRPHPHRIYTRAMRAVSFDVANGEADNSFILRVQLPGACDWHFTVYDKDRKAQFVSEKFIHQDFNKTADVKEFALSLPENAEGSQYEIKADFYIYPYMETAFGPKLVHKEGRRYGQSRVFVLERENGRYALKQKL